MSREVLTPVDFSHPINGPMKLVDFELIGSDIVVNRLYIDSESCGSQCFLQKPIIVERDQEYGLILPPQLIEQGAVVRHSERTSAPKIFTLPKHCPQIIAHRSQLDRTLRVTTGLGVK